jgi:DNA gyrase subunit B/topoisomerase-4 subunit B
VSNYDASSISVLEGLEAVRKRPGMYIGGTGKAGFHHLLWEIVDNSVDEAIAGHAKNIYVEICEDSAEVTDDGRGIPFDKHPKTKTSALDVIFTTLHAGGKFGDGAYKTSGGLHGVGSSVVNALSEWLHVSSTRGGQTALRKFSRGKPTGRLSKSKALKRAHGTTVTFKPDVEIFGNREFDIDLIRERIKVRAYLTPDVEFTLAYEDEEETFCFSGGLVDYLAETVEKQEASLITDFPFSLSNDEPRVQVALAWTDSSDMQVKSFANAIPTRDGGTHEKGLDSAIVTAVREVLADSREVPKRLKIVPNDIREGLCAFISVFVEEPQFQGQTKDRLNNPEVEKAVESAVLRSLQDWLRKNAEQTRALIRRIVRAAQARTAARTAADTVKRGSAVNRLRLPGKLSDCSSNDMESTELFLVEGDSAGGSAKMARDRKTQAILALRGKILNTENANLSKVMKNQELKNIVEALGCGIGPKFNAKKLRYGKVILLMDADSDGHHIAVLALTFFFRFLPDLVLDGRVFLAVPPLYRVDIGKKTFWASDDQHLSEIVEKFPRSNPEVTRFKGLGEMPPKTLWKTTMDPKTRMLERVTIREEDVEETEDTIAGLMGKDASIRYDMLMSLMESGSLSLDL